MHTKREGRGHFYFPYAIHSIGKQQTKNGYEDMHTYSDYSSKINKSFNNMFFIHETTVTAVVSLFFWNLIVNKHGVFPLKMGKTKTTFNPESYRDIPVIKLFQTMKVWGAKP